MGCALWEDAHAKMVIIIQLVIFQIVTTPYASWTLIPLIHKNAITAALMESVPMASVTAMKTILDLIVPSEGAKIIALTQKT